MEQLDLQRIAFLIGKEEPSVFKDYLNQVANKALLQYRQHFQWGGKQGESLYTHVLNGIQVLETLRSHIGLTDDQAQVLFTAFTVHDLNKVSGEDTPFGKVATHENIANEIARLGLDNFFPAWKEYREDIRSLIRGHSGHHHSGGERLVVKRDPLYRLGLEQVNALLNLMRAADIIDLSHTLDETVHKADFLSHLNAYLADSGQTSQYEFLSHRLTEQRGILTNICHNAIVTYMSSEHGLIPLLFYPDGVTYLAKKGEAPMIGADSVNQIAKAAAETVAKMTLANFEQFIDPRPAGIKVDAKCLELGLSFKSILRTIYNIIQRRTPDPIDLDSKARDWAQRGFEKNRTVYPNEVERIQSELSGMSSLVSTDVAKLRLAELVRTYYIFLSDHFAETVADGWLRVYQLLELPQEQWNYYAYFDARWARAYVLSRALNLSEEELYRRIEVDGESLMGSAAVADDPRVELFNQYLNLYASWGDDKQTDDKFATHLKQYVANQHQQCVYCSSPFPTDKWMAADVRSDITVQTFSNRLRGGGGEPKKYICAICHLQFLLEKLNYPEVRDEKTLYLHLYPYSFLTEPFIQGLSSTIRNIITEDTAVQALNLNVIAAVEEYLSDRVVTPTFRSRTAKDRPQPYGLYLPRYAETMGSLLIFPINPAGDNDTERFLFALWNAMILQRHFGVKVLMSDMAIPPLSKDEIPDLYVDNIPLGCRGLLSQNDYAQFAERTNQAGPLVILWKTVGHLFALRRLTFSTEDQTPRLVRALAGNPLTIFYETEKLLEARLRGQEQTGGLLTWLTQQAFPHVTTLAMNQGADFMTKLSQQLERLAVLVWQNRLIGRSLEKSSLLFALNEVFQKLNYTGAADPESLKAAAVQDIFDHLSRLADEQYKPGRKKWEVVQTFVDGWFDDVLNGVYGGNRRKFLSDEKLIRSAFHFYIRQQIPSKAANGDQLPEAETN